MCVSCAATEVGRIRRASGGPGSCSAGSMRNALSGGYAHYTRGAHTVVKGEARGWGVAVNDCAAAPPNLIYEGGKVDANSFLPARWDLIPPTNTCGRGADVRGCPKHCSFCSVWRTDGQKRGTGADAVIGEIVEQRRRGFRFVALADDNFYTVTLTDIKMAARRGRPGPAAVLEVSARSASRLMEKLAKLPSDMIFFTQITMEARRIRVLDAMRKARIKGALVGRRGGDPRRFEGVYKDFNSRGRRWSSGCGVKSAGVHVLGSSSSACPATGPA